MLVHVHVRMPAKQREREREREHVCAYTGNDGRLHLGRVGEIDKRKVNAVLHELHAANTVGAAVRAVRHDAVVAVCQE